MNSNKRKESNIAPKITNFFCSIPKKTKKNDATNTSKNKNVR